MHLFAPPILDHWFERCEFFPLFLVPFYLHHSHNNKIFQWPCLHPESNSYFSTVPFKEKGSTYFHLHFKNLP